MAAKTVLCRHYASKGRCPYGDKCNFAHGASELRVWNPRKPCWYHNHGGCSKSAEECIYDHVEAPEMRKPRHLQHPCILYHYHTPLKCDRGAKCGGDHFYELTQEEWEFHFSNYAYPGVGYLNSTPNPQPTLISKPNPTPQPEAPKQALSAWSKPLKIVDDGKSAVPKDPMPPMKKISPALSWADCVDDPDSEEDDHDFQYEQIVHQVNLCDVSLDRSPSDSPRSMGPLVLPPICPRKLTAAELANQVQELKQQIKELTAVIGAKPQAD